MAPERVATADAERCGSIVDVDGPEDLPSGRRQYYVPAPPDPGESAGGADRPSPPSRPPGSRPPRWEQPAAAPTRAPAAPGPTRARTGSGSSWLRRAARPKWRWLYLYAPLAVVLLLAGTLVWAYEQFNGIDRVDLGDAITASAGGATNYLLVGSDSRAGITSSTPNAGAIGTQVAGSRSDTIIVLRIQGGTATMMSIPRDLWATNVQTGKVGKINGAYNQGPANLVRTVTTNLGIPIDHYMEVDFVSFSGIVDAMGGIQIDFPHPAFDKHSGLNIIAAGTQTLDGTQALAYVRSRHYVEVVDGKLAPDPTADLGREQRQQNFIRTVLHDVGQTRNPWTLARIVASGSQGMKIDTRLGFGDAFSLARHLAGATPKTVVLPTRSGRKGREDVLLLQTAAAAQILSQFGGAPHAPS